MESVIEYQNIEPYNFFATFMRNTVSEILARKAKLDLKPDELVCYNTEKVAFYYPKCQNSIKVKLSTGRSINLTNQALGAACTLIALNQGYKVLKEAKFCDYYNDLIFYIMNNFQKDSHNIGCFYLSE